MLIAVRLPKFQSLSLTDARKKRVILKPCKLGNARKWPAVSCSRWFIQIKGTYENVIFSAQNHRQLAFRDPSEPGRTLPPSNRPVARPRSGMPAWASSHAGRKSWSVLGFALLARPFARTARLPRSSWGLGPLIPNCAGLRPA